MKLQVLAAAGIALAALSCAASAAEFKRIDECVPGAKVMDRKDRAGVVTRVSNGMCKVQFTGEEKEETLLHWMLRPAGASRTAVDKLAKGKYACYSGSNYAFIDIHIDGADRYHDKSGAKGRYRLDADSGKIVFESGSLREATAKLLAGPKIGLNMNGGNFFSTVCSLKS